MGIAVALVELCLPLLKTIYPKGLAVPRCGTEDITAGHTQGMITKDSPLSAHRLVWRWVLSGDLAVGIAMALVGLCLPLLETIYSKGLAVPRCGTGDITAGHTLGMITKDSPLSAHRLV